MAMTAEEIRDRLEETADGLWMISESDSRIEVVTETMSPVLTLREFGTRFYPEIELGAIKRKLMPDMYSQAAINRFRWLCDRDNNQHLKWRQLRDLLFDNLVNMYLYRIELPIESSFMFDELILGQVRGKETSYVGILYGLVET